MIGKFLRIFILTAFLFIMILNPASAREHNATNFTWQFLNLSEEELAPNENPEEFAKQVLNLVNKERSKRGIAPLHLASDLMEAAEIRAEEISRVFSHTRPNGKPCHSMFHNGQYTIGENIAAGHSTPEATVEQWMNSPGHRANILNDDYTELGVGYYYKSDSEYKYYWVQMFRRPMSKAIINKR